MVFASLSEQVMATPSIVYAVRQLTALFAREPECRLSLPEAEQLTGLDPQSCRIVLETLQDARVLARAGDGRFARSDRPQGAASAPPS
jgi:DNA-binding IclR family transcriptional regulator